MAKKKPKRATAGYVNQEKIGAVLVGQRSNANGTVSPNWHRSFQRPDGTTDRRAFWPKIREKEWAIIAAAKINEKLQLDPLGLHDSVKECRDLSFEKAMEEFLAVACGSLRPDSIDVYGRSLRKVRKRTGLGRLQAVDEKVLKQFASLSSQAGDSPFTINKDLRAARAFLNYCEDCGYIAKAPAFEKIFVKEPSVQPVVIPPEHFESMLAGAKKADLTVVKDSQWWEVLLRIGHTVGPRRSEILGLTWGRIDWESREFTISYQTSKSCRDRTVPIADSLLPVLKEWKRKSPAVGPLDKVLPWPGSLSAFHSNWRRIIAASGLPAGVTYKPKNLRSTAASDLIAANVPTLVVKEILGHSTVRVTEQFYVSVPASAMRAAVELREKGTK